MKLMQAYYMLPNANSIKNLILNIIQQSTKTDQFKNVGRNEKMPLW